MRKSGIRFSSPITRPPRIYSMMMFSIKHHHAINSNSTAAALDVAGRRWSARTCKEMVLQSSMSLREGTDHRGTARASWSAYVEKEPEA